jgi:NAD(P)-dependent dehydrogenase (short-subunit alcohol dehydrogenase family)
MELRGSTVVVTGGGAGIGEALARRFAADGARVVVNDIDEAHATRVAHAIGGHAVPCDASTGHGVTRLLAAAREQYGEIDLYCANAGVARGGGPEAPDEAWAISWEVNVMAHVRAARALLPAWVARGRGHFLATVSAAGLLSHVSAAPYAVSKHGALAFAEWLSIAYGDRGITVQALCPQGVRTNMLLGGDDVGNALLLADALPPDKVADTVLEALADGRFLILPHPQVAKFALNRAADRDRWLAGMRRIQSQVTSGGGESTEYGGRPPAVPPAP